MMTPEYIQTLVKLMEFEAARTEPPRGLSGPARYSGRALCRSALPPTGAGAGVAQVLAAGGTYRRDTRAGCFLLWENAGQPVVIVHAESGA